MSVSTTVNRSYTFVPKQLIIICLLSFPTVSNSELPAGLLTMHHLTTHEAHDKTNRNLIGIVLQFIAFAIFFCDLFKIG